MVSELIQTPFIQLLCHPSTPRGRLLRKPHKATSATHSKIIIFSISSNGLTKNLSSGSLRQLLPIQATYQTSADTEPSEEYTSLANVKAALYQALQGTNRGIFGVQSAKKLEIEGLVNLMESLNPTPNPTENLEKVDGSWKLLYSSISILGAKRTKLGLRDFVYLGDFLQFINVPEGKAVNVIKFSVKGFKFFTGQLVIVATFKIASKSRVDIKYESSSISPDQLMSIFQKNYDMLLAIFNPEGWLEISFVDESMRIGRDDKGNIFILERSETDNIKDYIL